MTGALTIASGTLTASAPALNITQTWNSGAVQFNSILINITDSASSSISTFFEMQIAGTVRHLFTKGGRYTGASAVLAGPGASSGVTSTGVAINNFVVGIRNSSLSEFSWTSGNLNGTVDLALYRDAAATLAQRNGTNQQIFRLYNTYTDASNYERLTLTGVAGTSVNITAETLGTGGDNIDIVLTPAGTGSVLLKNSSGTTCLTVASTTHATFAGNINVVGLVGFTTGGSLRMESDGVCSLRDSTAATFARLNLGPGTSSFPSLKRSGTQAQVRLADDSAYASIAALYTRTPAVAFASLVAAATAGDGARACINNCSTAVFNAAADGAGALKVPVWCDGSAWYVG